MPNYIDKNKALEVLNDKYNKMYGYNPGHYAAYQFALDSLKRINCEDVAPVIHAKWITAPHKSSRFCSKCYHDEPYKFADSNANIYNYCPHCGAKMDFEENPND